MKKNQSKINIMIKAAYSAGKILRLAFNQSSAIEVSKSYDSYDVFSKADIDSEEQIIKILSSKLPYINILSEEKGFINKNSAETILVDPLDGSSNFLLGLPHFSISLAYLFNNKLQASVIYNPILNKMYHAEKGKGAFLNNKKLKIKLNNNSKYISVNFAHKTKWTEKSSFFDWAYKSHFSRVMNNWSPNLDYCLFAESKIDAVVSKGSLIYDYAPGLLIAKEAGGKEYPKINKIEVNPKHTKHFIIISKKIKLTNKELLKIFSN